MTRSLLMVCVAALSASPAVAQHTVPFTEDWTTGLLGERWYTKDQKGIELVDNGHGDKWQRETIRYDAGRVFMTKGIEVRAGQTYCVQATIRATPGAAAYLGIWGSTADGMLRPISESHFLFGQEGYGTGFGAGRVVPIKTDKEWREYSASFVAPETWTHFVLFDELYVKGDPGTADFDDLKVSSGDCGGKAGSSEPLTLNKGSIGGCSVAGRAMPLLALSIALLSRRRRRLRSTRHVSASLRF